MAFLPSRLLPFLTDKSMFISALLRSDLLISQYHRWPSSKCHCHRLRSSKRDSSRSIFVRHGKILQYAFHIKGCVFWQSTGCVDQVTRWIEKNVYKHVAKQNNLNNGRLIQHSRSFSLLIWNLMSGSIVDPWSPSKVMTGNKGLQLATGGQKVSTKFYEKINKSKGDCKRTLWGMIWRIKSPSGTTLARFLDSSKECFGNSVCWSYKKDILPSKATTSDT